MYFVNSSEWSIVSRKCIQKSVRSFSTYNRDLNKYKVWIKVAGGLFLLITIALLVIWVTSGMNPDVMVLPAIGFAVCLLLAYMHKSVSTKQYIGYLSFERGYDGVTIEVPDILIGCAARFYHAHQPPDYVRYVAKINGCEHGEVDHIEAEEPGFHRRWLEEFPEIFQRYLLSISELASRIDSIQGPLRDRYIDDLYRISVPIYVQIAWQHDRAIEYAEAGDSVSASQETNDFNDSMQRAISAIKDLRLNVAATNRLLDRYT